MARGHEHPHLDDADSQRDLGMMHLLTREFDLAGAALEASLALGDRTSTFLLALARIGQRRPMTRRHCSDASLLRTTITRARSNV